MISSPKVNKKLRKMTKRLTTRPLFKLGKNSKHTFGRLMELPVNGSLDHRSIEDQSLHVGRVSADDFYYHFKGKLTIKMISSMFRIYLVELRNFLKNNKLWRSSGFTIAIDKTEELYWGDHNDLFVTGGQRKSSTNYAYRYLTASIVVEEYEFIIYSRALTKKDDDDALLVEECIQDVKKLGFPVKKVLQDREFFNEKIITLLNIHKLRYIIPVVKNDRFKRLLEEIQHEGKSLPRIIENYEIGDEITNLVIYEETNSKGENETFGFITNIDAREISKDVWKIVDEYRSRWGIENANKFQDSFRIPTNSTDGMIRFFFFIISAILHNFWVLLTLMAEVFHLIPPSLSSFKDIVKALYGFAPVPHYKHPQRERWVKILIG